jgi:putative peptide zinc metalloprotease protein
MPLWKAAKHVLKSPTLRRQRVRAVRTAAGIAAAVIVVGAFVPVPLRTQANGVVWLPDRAMLRAGANGFFQRWLVEPGTSVKAGTPVLLMEDPLLASELEVARAKLAEVQARYNSEQFSNPVKAEVTRQQLEHESRAFDRANEKFSKLVTYAANDGVLTVAKPQDMPSQYFKKGEVLGYVLDRNDLIARVVVQQDNIDLVRTRLRSAELRIADALGNVHSAAVVRELPGGVDELPSAALGPNGGGSIPVDPKDSNGVKTLERVFVYDMQLPPGAAPKAFGERVHVRFIHDGEPLAAQGYRRLRQLFLTRFHV